MRLDYTKVKVLQDAFVLLLNNQFLSDIKLKFADGRIIFAHSFVLCCRSDEFCDSFETTVGVSKLIEVGNVLYEEYFEFLKYLYTDACNIDDSNAKSVIQLSKKHELPELKTKCFDVMFKDMNVENVCTILGMSIELQLENLKIQSAKFIADNYAAALNSESFLKIRDEALKAILELDPVSEDDELKVFNATMKWAEKACLKDGLEASGSLKRQKLGDNLKLLRFGAMTSEEFTACVQIEAGLLTNEEMVSIFMNLSSGKKNSFGFADKKRQLGGLRNSDNVVIYDYDQTNTYKNWSNNGSILQSTNFNFTFSVSQSIAIKKINFTIQDRVFTMIQFLENSTIISEGPDLSDFLNSEKILHANTRYTLNLTINGRCGWFCLNTDIQFQSESGKCEFTVYKNSTSIIKNITFKC